MSREEIAAIAAGLTKAQRKRLLDLDQLNQRGLSWASAFGSARLDRSRATSRVLLDAGLIAPLPMTNRGALTPLGLAVRQHLITHSEDPA